MSPRLVVHSMNCSFLTAPDASQPIFYHVGRQSDGKSFTSRLVQAKQSGRTVLTALCSFMALVQADAKSMLHQNEMPKVDVSPSEDESDQTNDTLFTAEIVSNEFMDTLVLGIHSLRLGLVKLIKSDQAWIPKPRRLEDHTCRC